MSVSAPGQGAPSRAPSIVPDPQVKQWLEWAGSTRREDLERLRAELTPIDAVDRVDPLERRIRYATDHSTRPEPDRHLTPAAKTRLRRIATEKTRTLRLTASQQAAIRSTLALPALRGTPADD